MRNAGRVVSKTMILSHVWDYNFDPQTNIVDVLVSRLREKIDRPFEKKLLHTVRGVGYVLRPDVTDAASACASRCGTRRCSSPARIAIVVAHLLPDAASLAQRDQQIIDGKLGDYAAAYARGGVARARRDRAGRAAGRARAAVRARRRRGVEVGRAQQPRGLGSGEARDRIGRARRRHAGAGREEHRGARRSAGAVPRRARASSRCSIVVIALTGGWLATQSALSSRSAG